MNAKPEELMSLLEKKTPRIYVQVFRASNSITGEMIDKAKAQGYKVTVSRTDDPSDPGGCMSLAEVYGFELKA